MSEEGGTSTRGTSSWLKLSTDEPAPAPSDVTPQETTATEPTTVPVPTPPAKVEPEPKPEPEPEPVKPKVKVDEEEIRELRSSYDRQLARARKEREDVEARAQQLEWERIQQLPPETRENYLKDYYNRRLLAEQKRADILEASVTHGIPLEELEQVQTRAELASLIRLKLVQREEEERLEKKRQRMEREFEASKEALQQELMDKLRRELREEMGLNKVATGTGGGAVVSEKQQRINEIKTEIEALKKAAAAGRGRTRECLQLQQELYRLEQSE